MYSYDEGDKAFVIAKTMSGLCHLELKGFLRNYGGLPALLGGCPLLKSLNLRGCLCPNFSPGLGKRFRDSYYYDDGLAYMDTFEDT